MSFKQELNRKLLWLALFCAGLLPALNAYAYSYPQLGPVSRYTSTGQQDASGHPCYSRDVGLLDAKQGFIVSGVNVDGVCADGLQAINGQPVLELASWTAYNPSNFKRSGQTYAINGVPFVIIYSGSGASYIRKPYVSLSVYEDGNQVAWSSTTEGVNSGNSDEQNHLAGFLLTLDESSSQDTKVLFSIGGTAKNGKDYSKIQGYKIIPAGQKSATVLIEAIDDVKKERIEKVKLKLKTSKKFYKISTPSAVSVEILDND